MMMELDPPNPSVEQRAATIRRAMKEVRKIHAARKVSDALATRNGPGMTNVHTWTLVCPVRRYVTLTAFTVGIITCFHQHDSP